VTPLPPAWSGISVWLRQLDFGRHDQRQVQRDCRDADRRSGVCADRRPEHGEDDVRERVEHESRLCVAGVGVHEAIDDAPTGDAVEVADGLLEPGDHRQCREPGRLLSRLE
jgi:hypothetical protein